VMDLDSADAKPSLLALRHPKDPRRWPTYCLMLTNADREFRRTWRRRFCHRGDEFRGVFKLSTELGATA
jgi:hypothetical protein